MTKVRRGWLSFLADWMVRLHRDRPDREEMSRRVRAMSFETDVSKMGVRMTGSLRDRLRSRWLRLRKD